MAKKEAKPDVKAEDSKAEEKKKDQGKGFGTKIKIWIAEHLQIASISSLVVILLLGYLVVFAPQLKKIRAANISKSLESEQDSKNDYLITLNKLATRYSTVSSENVESLRTMIPLEEDIPGILAALEAGARNADIAITSINFSKIDPTGAIEDIDGIEIISIVMTLDHGTYERLKLFVESMESSLRLFDIRSMDLNPESASYNLSIRAYVLAKPSVIPKILL